MNAQYPAAIKTAIRHRFYYAVVFLSVVTIAFENNRQPLVSGLSWRFDGSIDTTFKDFVNTLCQFCDVKLGGDSVTAFTVLDLQDRIQYRFACNKRNKSQLTRTLNFVENLLGILRGVTVVDADLRSRLLSKALGFCRVRVHSYLGALKEASIACMGTEPVEIALMDQLQALMQASKQADFGSLDDFTFADRVDHLINLIDEIRGSARSVFRERAAQSSMNQSSSSWSELRHYAGRLLSFSHGVTTMTMAADMLPRLFDDPEVIFVASSTPDGNPIQKRVTLERMLRSMTSTSQMAAHYQSLADEARAISLETTVQQEVQKDTFRPIVHAELLVLQSLERDDLTHSSNFFNSWKYIGSSKPTCKLCDYYFRAHTAGFQVRPSHGNLYTNWKPPDVYQRDGQEAVLGREQMMNTIAVWVRQEALRTLVEKVPRGRSHDSSTGMTLQSSTMGNPVVVGLSTHSGPADDLETYPGDPDDGFD